MYRFTASSDHVTVAAAVVLVVEDNFAVDVGAVLDVIAAADERDLVMVFTSIRHFKH